MPRRSRRRRSGWRSEGRAARRTVRTPGSNRYRRDRSIGATRRAVRSADFAGLRNPRETNYMSFDPTFDARTLGQAAAIRELSRVALIDGQTTADGRDTPAGSQGTIVATWARGAADEVEFTEPFATLVTLEPDRFRVIADPAFSSALAFHSGMRSFPTRRSSTTCSIGPIRTGGLKPKSSSRTAYAEKIRKRVPTPCSTITLRAWSSAFGTAAAVLGSLLRIRW